MAATAVIVTDISNGDSGKGTTVDHYVRSADSALVIRHSGGAQAAHNVVSDNVHHTFAQFGSGSLVPGVRTHLSRFMLVNPLNMLREAAALIKKGQTDIWERLSVDGDALVITPWHRSANRLRELSRGTNPHGSCGQGIGETASDGIKFPNDVIRVRDLCDPKLSQKLEGYRSLKLESIKQELAATMPRGDQAKAEWDVFNDPNLISALLGKYQAWAGLTHIVDGEYLKILESQHDLLVFEGSQGVLLDERYGFYPYTTWSNTTHGNALTLLDEIGFEGEVTRLGVLRAYATRHGYGPFVTEDQGMTAEVPDMHNGTGKWQGDFRVGHLDLVAGRYALDVTNGADGLVVTGLDRLAYRPEWLYCNAYERGVGADPTSDTLFRCDSDGYAIGINRGPSSDLNYYAALTAALLACKPHYDHVDRTADFEADAANLLHLIEDSLGVPINLASFGPAAADKRVLRTLSASR